MTASFEKTENKITEIILAAVKEQDSKIGKGMLALTLKGSNDKKIYARKLNESKFYGALLWQPIEVIENFIGQLIEQGFITINLVGFYGHPVLALSETGNFALEDRILFPLAIHRKEKETKLNESMKLTLELFKKHKSADKVSQERKLVETTVYQHLSDLIKLGKLSINEVVSEEVQTRVQKAKKAARTDSLREIKEQIPDISYGEIKCVLAAMMQLRYPKSRK